MQELCTVEEQSGGGWAVRLVGGQLVSTQRDEADASEIADLVTFKRALDEGFALDTVLLRLPNAREEFRESEEELRNLSWSQLLTNLGATQQQDEAGEAEVAAAESGDEEAAAHSSSQVPSLQDVTEQGLDPAGSGEQQQQQQQPASKEQQQQHATQASTVQAAGCGAAAAAGVGGAAQPAAGAEAFSPPSKLLGCYRQPNKPSVLSVQVSLPKVPGEKHKTTTFFGTYTVPEAAGMARDAVVVWQRLRRGDPLHGRPCNFPLPLYTSNAELMAELAACADVEALKAYIKRKFQGVDEQAAAAAAVAAAGAVVPAMPPIGPTAGERKAAKREAAAVAAAAGAAAFGTLKPGVPTTAAAAAAEGSAGGGGGGSGGASGGGTRNQWRVLEGGGVQKVMPGACEKVVYVSEMAWAALFGSQEARPHLMLLHEPTHSHFPVDASHEPCKAAFRLGKGWAAAARALRVRQGDTLGLQLAEKGGACTAGAAKGAKAGPAAGAAGPAGVVAAAGAAVAAGAGKPQQPTVVLVSVVHSTPPSGNGAALGALGGANVSGGSGAGASPFAGKKRSAEAAGLLRSPGGTAKQLCVDTMLAAASDRQQLGQQQQQQQERLADLVKYEPTEQQQTQTQRPQQQGQQAQQAQQQQQQHQLMLLPQQPTQSQPGQQPVAETATEPATAAAAAAMPPETAAAAAVAAAAEAAADVVAPAIPSGADPYQLYRTMKPAVRDSGLPAAVRHAYFQAFMRLPAWQQCMHCEEVTEMAAEGLHTQLRQFLESEAAAGAAVLGQASGQPPASTMSGGGASGHGGADRASCL